MLDIPQLRKKRQFNVQEQNALRKHSILNTALAFQANKEPWINTALKLHHLNPDAGILVESSSVICGTGIEIATALWFTTAHIFYELEAIITVHTYELVELERFTNVTTQIPINCHEKGTGKSLGCLALEVLIELG